MELLKDYYDVNSLFKILEIKLGVQFTSLDLLEWIEADLVTPIYPYKGNLCFAEKIDDTFSIYSCGYAELYLTDKFTSKSLIGSDVYEKKSRPQASALEGYTKLFKIPSSSAHYKNKDSNFNLLLHILNQDMPQDDIYVLTNQIIYRDIQSKYLYDQETEQWIDKEFSLENDSILIKEYFELEYPSELIINDFFDIRKFTRDDILVPKNQILEIISTYSSYKEKQTIKHDKQLNQENEKLLLIIGAMLEERKQSAGGKRIQSLVAQNIEDMTKNTGAMLSESKLEKIFSSANKAFKPYTIN